MIKTEPSKETLIMRQLAAEETIAKLAGEEMAEEQKKAAIDEQANIIQQADKQIKLIEKMEAKALKREREQAPAREKATVTAEDLEKG